MTASLFLERTKEAAVQVSPTIKNRVEGPPEMWPEQITTALFAEHPYLAEYEPSIEEVRSDGDMGYYLGYVIFGVDDREIKIPVFIRDWEILPFATFAFDEEILPLTEERIREAQMNQAAIDASDMTDPEVEELMRDQNMDPPDHLNYMGNRYIATKLSSMSEEAVERLFKVAETKSASIYRYLKKLLSSKKGEAMDKEKEKTASFAPYHDTFLIEPLGGHRFSITSMSSAFRKEATRIVNRNEMRALPRELVKKAYEEGYAVEGGPEPMLEDDITAGAQEVDRTGVWNVKTTSGEDLVGAVITKVLDFTNIALPLKLFYNGERSATQDVIAGVWVDELLDPTGDLEPSGECIFICKDPLRLEVTATVPFVVTGEVATNYGPGWAVETYLGDRINLVQSDVVKMTEIEQGTFLIPSSYRLKCIAPPEGRTDLVAMPSEFESFHTFGTKEAARLVGDFSGAYSLTGGGFDERFIDAKTAHFKLAAMGAPDPERLLKKARVLGKVSLFGLVLPDLSDEIEGRYDDLVKRAGEFCDTLEVDMGQVLSAAGGLLDWMTKKGEADSETIDTILSLGFVNADNARDYVEAESDLEDAQKALAALTVASQMGYSDVPMNDAIGAMQSMEEVLDGLRKLRVEVE